MYRHQQIQQFSKKEIEDLLRKGAYAAIMDENDEGSRFCEEDIDQILQRRATTITIESEGKGSTFSKASFVASENRNDIALDDPEFWEKWAKKADIDVDTINRKVGASIIYCTQSLKGIYFLVWIRRSGQITQSFYGCSCNVYSIMKVCLSKTVYFPHRTLSSLTLPESASRPVSTPVYEVKVETCLSWTVTMSTHLPIPDSHVPPDVLTATAVGVTDALTVSGWKNTCLSMGTCTLVLCRFIPSVF